MLCRSMYLQNEDNVSKKNGALCATMVDMVSIIQKCNHCNGHDLICNLSKLVDFHFKWIIANSSYFFIPVDGDTHITKNMDQPIPVTRKHKLLVLDNSICFKYP